MDLNQIEEKIKMYIEQPRTAYQLCADTGLGFSTILTYLKILEAGGKVSRTRSRKTTLWTMIAVPVLQVKLLEKSVAGGSTRKVSSNDGVSEPAQPGSIESEEDK